MATLADVAVKAGVSKAAASYALGARPAQAKLALATRRRILAAARDLGYRPNPIATALSTGRTHIIGLLIHSPLDVLTHPNGAWSFGAMMTAAAQHGYRVMVLNPQPGPALDVRTMDACVVLGWIEKELLGPVREMVGRITVVTTHHDIPGAIHIAQTHDTAALESHRRAADYLFDQGHRHVAVVDVVGARLPASGVFRERAAARGIRVRIDVA